ncbi:MAG: hypothetical protein LBG92_05740 [Prevotellaceae bacterium]|jgi:hypothetical protein|nr:hypothetical protein [Prevotellaceae bacterium]
MSDSNKIIQGLWVDGQLKKLQRLCIKSFIDNGHDFHLYTYNMDINAPAGTVVKDAGAIIPEKNVFLDGRGSLGAFSDWFRYRLLYETGGWWADVDMLCLKPFDFEDDYVFSSENGKNFVQETNVGVIKVPPKSDIMAYCLQYISKINLSDRIEWNSIGCCVVNSFIEKNREYNLYVQKPHIFCPIPYYYYSLMYNNVLIDLSEKSYGVHLWNEMLRGNNIDADSQFHKNSLYERLKNRCLFV